MRVGFYGNNLNQGYFFVRALAEFGIDAKLFLPNYNFAQESHEWWMGGDMDEDLLYRINHRFNLTYPEPLKSEPRLLKLYEVASTFDIIILMEDGPAVFSEFNERPKVFLSQGSDLQILPFLLEYHGVKESWGKSFLGLLESKKRRQHRFNVEYWRNSQERQRLGIRQCARLLCSPHQLPIVNKLKYPKENVRTLPILMYSQYLAQVERGEVADLASQFSKYETVFFHPTRQMYLPINNDIYLKRNDQLIRGYAAYLNASRKESILLMIEKGRNEDIKASRDLISQLGLSDKVRWIPEIPNRSLRSYFSLDNIVICDQFSENLATLGNIGREATYYGAPLITAFKDYNYLVYGSDMPPNLLPATTSSEIALAMLKIEGTDSKERAVNKELTKSWFIRNCDYRNILPKYIDILSDVVSSDGYYS